MGLLFWLFLFAWVRFWIFCIFACAKHKKLKLRLPFLTPGVRSWTFLHFACAKHKKLKPRPAAVLLRVILVLHKEKGKGWGWFVRI